MNDINQDRLTTASDFFEKFRKDEKVVAWRGPPQDWYIETSDHIDPERMALLQSGWSVAEAALEGLFSEVGDHWTVRVIYDPPDEREGGMWLIDIAAESEPKTYFGGGGETLTEAMDDILPEWRECSVFSEAANSLHNIAKRRSVDAGDSSLVAKATIRLLRERGVPPALETTLGHLEWMLALTNSSA